LSGVLVVVIKATREQLGAPPAVDNYTLDPPITLRVVSGPQTLHPLSR
jgi:hypothetical protein